MGAALLAILNEKSSSTNTIYTFEEDPILHPSPSPSASIVPLPPLHMAGTGVSAWENESSCSSSNFLLLVFAFAFIALYWYWNTRFNSSKKVHSVPCPPVLAQLQMRV